MALYNKSGTGQTNRSTTVWAKQHPLTAAIWVSGLIGFAFIGEPDLFDAIISFLMERGAK